MMVDKKLILIKIIIISLITVSTVSAKSIVKTTLSGKYWESAITINNEYLDMTIFPNGGFTGKTASGDCIFYPGDTSDLTIKVGSNEYDIRHGSLDVYRTKDTYVNPDNNKEAITEWDLPEGIHVEQHIKLEGDHVMFTVILRNNKDYDQVVSVRYLWDTQLCDNDGSPLMANGVLYTKEVCFEPVEFDHWSAYSRPSESEAKLVTYCWWVNTPDRIIFAHWPEAIGSVYYYNWDPNRPFYTPGYVTSPQSDSCVLMYWENIAVPAHGERTITVFYGTSMQTGLSISIRLDKDEYYPVEPMNVYVKILDANGNTNYPLTRDNTIVKIDGNRVSIDDIVPSTNGEYIIKVKAPLETGEHTIYVQVVTDQGSVSASKSFRVREFLRGKLIIDSKEGTVDEATKNWKYPTHYNAPVFRRGMDTPVFIFTPDEPILDGYVVEFEIWDANNRPIAHKFSTNTEIRNGKISYICKWHWDDDIRRICLDPSQLPIGIYKVKVYIVDKNDPNVRYPVTLEDSNTEFYVIFEFDKDMQSFVTWSQETDYVKVFNIIQIHNTYDLHIYNPIIWKKAIEWANGAITTKDAVNKISELARRIDGSMVYHHANDDETWVFLFDGYDNNFNGIKDERGENWSYNYEPYGGLAWWIRGRAYNRSYFNHDPNMLEINDKKQWIDGNGRCYKSAEHADQIAWYLDTMRMLKEDFDPEDKVSHQHSLGVCEDYAMLTVGYLRSIGIPARVVTGELVTKSGNTGCHAWLQWLNVTGNGEWTHLDTDYVYNNTTWEKNKFNISYYRIDIREWRWVLVRTGEVQSVGSLVISGISDIADLYNSYIGVSSGGVRVYGQATNLNNDNGNFNYVIENISTLKPGENSTIKLCITNSYSENKTVDVTILLIPQGIIIGGSLNPLTSATKQVTIPANSTITVNINLTIPGDASPGNYSLEIYEDQNLVLEQIVQILPTYNVTVEIPSNVVYQMPFMFNVTVRNNSTVPIHNVSVSLDLHYYFNTTEPIRKEIPVLNPGENYTFTWNLTPVNYGDLRIDVCVFTVDGGSYGKTIRLHVLQTPKLWITPTVPETVKKGEDFFLKVTVHNSGDITSDPVTLTIITPENVTANVTSVDLGVIEAHENKTYTFRISQNENDDFVIIVNATSASATAEDYVIINVTKPSMWIDALVGNETPGTEHHTDVIETLYGEPCNLTVYIKNTGEVKLTNVTVLTNFGVTKYVGDVDVGDEIFVPISFTPTTVGLSDLNVTVKSDEIEETITRSILVEKFNFTVSIPKIKFNQSEPVPINISVTNEVPDIRFIDAKIVIEIVGINYSKTFSIPLLSLAPLETKTTEFTWDTIGINNGTYTIRVSLMIADREVLSCVKYAQIGEVLPDLAISSSDISYVPQSPRDGDVVSITAKIHNIGVADANNITVSFFDGMSLIGNTTISVKANSIELASINWTATAGTHVIRVVVDPENKLIESNENNNEASIVITVKQLPPLPGHTKPPKDLDGDGVVEDFNGNGILDFNDVVELYKNMDWIKQNYPLSKVDQNKDGKLDFDDVIIIFRRI